MDRWGMSEPYSPERMRASRGTLRRALVALALLVGCGIVAAPASACGPAPACAAAPDRKAAEQKLFSRATGWVNARKSLKKECWQCNGVGKGTGNGCTNCVGGWAFSPKDFTKVYFDIRSPAWRSRPQATNEFDQAFERLKSGTLTGFALTSARPVKIEMVDDTHAFVRVTESTKQGELNVEHKWIFVATGTNTSEWFLYEPSVDGPWPPQFVPEAKPAPKQEPVAEAPRVETPKKAAPVAPPKAAPAPEKPPAARGSLLTVPVAKPALPFDPAQSAGLFVGVRKFVESGSGAPSDVWTEVEYAVDDAVDLAYAFSIELKLIVPGRVHLCLSGTPQKEESIAHLEELRANGATIEGAPRNRLRDKVRIVCKQAEKGGLLVMAFATHGAHTDDGDDCLYTQDATFGDYESGLSARFVREQTLETLAPRKILLFDSCREFTAKSARGTGAEPLSPTLAKTLGDLQGTIVLCASSVGGFSYDDPKRKNGVFTRAFLDGLAGKAQANASGLITLGAVVTYVNAQVKDWIILNRPGAKAPASIDQSGDKDLEQLPLAQYRGLPKAAAPK